MAWVRCSVRGVGWLCVCRWWWVGRGCLRRWLWRIVWSWWPVLSNWSTGGDRWRCVIWTSGWRLSTRRVASSCSPWKSSSSLCRSSPRLARLISALSHTRILSFIVHALRLFCGLIILRSGVWMFGERSHRSLVGWDTIFAVLVTVSWARLSKFMPRCRHLFITPNPNPTIFMTTIAGWSFTIIHQRSSFSCFTVSE